MPIVEGCADGGEVGLAFPRPQPATESNNMNIKKTLMINGIRFIFTWYRNGLILLKKIITYPVFVINL